MALHTWVAFAFVSVLVSATPGPALLTVLACSLRGGFQQGLRSIVGILVADAVFFACAAAGLGAVLLKSPAVFGTVKWLGILYLAYLGLRALLERDEPVDPHRALTVVRHPAVLGLMTQLANPKIVIFIAALVPPFIDLHAAVASQFGIFGATFVLSDAIVFTFVALFASRARRILERPHARTVTRRVTGFAMLGVATRIALDR